ncbi:glycosyltransferase family 61 protein (plasmid) [Paracoccus liaowanqingii]|uniref:Glycosyltransferase family 61 protein n=1 Tax=Paracoccus liaowanqingii TaxID=2560053 RepID=A0A4Y5SSI7_9RHOB|nr:glycosyltransferase family 61 protein [Paracoccus liaowanqingii]QDA35674.1 glycosyltransferase family 61 protein [Paracoccus liaowanqingii]
MTLLPLVHRFRKRIGFFQKLQDAAAEILVLAPEEKNQRLAAISLPAQIDRIRAVQSDTSLDYEASRLTSGEINHTPTRAFLLKNAWYINGVIFAGNAREPQVPERESLISFEKTKHLTRAAFPSSLVGSQYFGHHVVDDSATTLLANEFGPVFRAPAKAARTWPHAAAYRTRLNIEAPVLTKARVAEAWVFQDWGMTGHRRDRLIKLRLQLRDTPGSRIGHGVFLRRRGSGAARLLANEQEIEEKLSSLGFEIIDPTNDSIESIIMRCRDAGIVVGVEGSGLAHGFLSCAPNAKFLVLQHPYRFNNVWKDFTDALEMRYAFLVGEGTKDSFHISPDELCATLDLLSF